MTKRTEDQDTLLDLLHMSTRPWQVDGRSFREFLNGASEELRAAVQGKIRDLDAIEPTLTDIEACDPADVVGEMYDDLVGVASDAYGGVLEEPFSPPLSRTVIQRSGTRKFYLRGQVAPSRKAVELILHASGFDMLSLALVPYILAHELVCHIGARHTGVWEELPDPDIRGFFEDGFMDRAAWTLLLTWLDEGKVRNAIPVGHLSEAELPYASLRPDAFTSGRAAWSNCRSTIATHLPEGKHRTDDGVDVRGAYADDAIIEGALRLNAVASDIKGKDAFVDRARIPDEDVTAAFAEVALGNSPPEDLL